MLEINQRLSDVIQIFCTPSSVHSDYRSGLHSDSRSLLVPKWSAEMIIREPKYSDEHNSWFIPLTQGVIALIDADMMQSIGRHNWVASRIRKCWYATRKPNLFMHRVIMKAPSGKKVDHARHYPLSEKIIDNRRSNLRVCTNSQNICNQRPRRGGSSRFKGVSWHKSAKKWRSQIKVNGKQKYLGHYDDELMAARAYDAVAPIYHGKFALTNKDAGLL